MCSRALKKFERQCHAVIGEHVESQHIPDCRLAKEAFHRLVNACEFECYTFACDCASKHRDYYEHAHVLDLFNEYTLFWDHSCPTPAAYFELLEQLRACAVSKECRDRSAEELNE